MSIEIYVLYDQRLASMAEWQQAIDAAGFALRSDTERSFEEWRERGLTDALAPDLSTVAGDMAGVALAAGAFQIVNAQMARALRRVSVERGHDPRVFCLVPFRRGGPLHACELAELVGIRRILVPPHPGTLSALG